MLKIYIYYAQWTEKQPNSVCLLSIIKIIKAKKKIVFSTEFHFHVAILRVHKRIYLKIPIFLNI